MEEEEAARLILDASYELFKAGDTQISGMLSLSEVEGVLGRLAEKLFRGSALQRFEELEAQEIRTQLNGDGMFDFHGFVCILCTCEPWASLIPASQHDFLLSLAKEKSQKPKCPVPNTPVPRPPVPKPPVPKLQMMRQPQPVPDVPVDIMNQIAAADGWCLATGHLVEKKGAKPTKLPDFKLKVDDGQLQGYCCTEIEGRSVRGTCRGLIKTRGRDRVAMCLTEDYNGEMGRCYEGLLEVYRSGDPLWRGNQALRLVFKGTARNLYADQTLGSCEIVLQFGASICYAAMMQSWLRKGNVVMEDIESEARLWQATPAQHSSIDRFVDRYTRACEDTLIDPIDSAVQPLIANGGTELALEYCRGQVNDGQIYCFSLALWNLDKLQCLRIAHARSVTDIGVRVLSEALCLAPSLQLLEVSNTQMGNAGAKAIAKAVANCPTITHLNLQNNGISDPGAVALAETIASHPNIAVLELGHLSAEGRGVEQNALWSDGCDSNSCLGRFSELLVRVFSPICSTAHAVYVPEESATRNNIGEEGAIALANAVYQNNRMTQLDLLGNPIGAGGSHQVARVMLESSTLERVTMSCWVGQEPQIDEKGINTLLHVLESPHCPVTSLDFGYVILEAQDLTNADPVMGGGAADLLAHVAAKVNQAIPAVKYQMTKSHMRTKQKMVDERNSILKMKGSACLSKVNVAQVLQEVETPPRMRSRPGTPRAGASTPRAAMGTPRAGAGTPRAAMGTPRAGGKTPRAGAGTPRAGGRTPRAAFTPRGTLRNTTNSRANTPRGQTTKKASLRLLKATSYFD